MMNRLMLGSGLALPHFPSLKQGTALSRLMSLSQQNVLLQDLTPAWERVT